MLVDYGKHSSLIIPDLKGGHLEYAFGEWNYFAREKTQWYRLPTVLLLPTASTLAKGEYPNQAALDRHLNRFVTEIFPLATEQSKLEDFKKYVQGIYESGLESHYRKDLEFNFVKLPNLSYSLLRNCNSVMISWLKKLGVTHQGLGLTSKWSVVVSSTEEEKDAD